MPVRIDVRNPKLLALTGLVLFLLLARVPVEIAHFIDRTVGFSGTVVEKGEDSHVIGIFGPLWDPYVVIQDSSGHRQRRWVTRTEHAMAEVGTWVVKSPGYAADVPWHPYVKRPGQLSPFQQIDTAKALLREKNPARRDSLIRQLKR